MASVLELLNPLVKGATVADWTLVGVLPLLRGASGVLLRDGARTVQVDVGRRDPSLNAPSSTEFFDLIVSNGADGERSTPRPLMIAVTRLAEVIRANETEGLVAGYATLTARLQQRAQIGRMA